MSEMAFTVPRIVPVTFDLPIRGEYGTGTSLMRQPALAARRNDVIWLRRSALAGGAAMAALVALLSWAVSGTSLGRSLAVSLCGAGSEWQAAMIFATDDHPLRARLITETRTLLQYEIFAAPYAECLDRAKRSNRVVNCRLTVPAIGEIN